MRILLNRQGAPVSSQVSELGICVRNNKHTRLQWLLSSRCCCYIDDTRQIFTDRFTYDRRQPYTTVQVRTSRYKQLRSVTLNSRTNHNMQGFSHRQGRRSREGEAGRQKASTVTREPRVYSPIGMTIPRTATVMLLPIR